VRSSTSCSRLPCRTASPVGVELEPVEGAEDDALPPLHEAAFQAIERGDLAGAAAAYEQALAENPKDHDAELGLAQVGLMQRTTGVDLTAARAAAAADPADVDAACVVADLDVSVATSRTPSPGCSTSCGPATVLTATRPARTCSSCSRSSATTTSGFARGAPP
jgi:hypothetical protein